MLAKFKRKQEPVKTLTPHQQHSKELFEAMARVREESKPRRAKMEKLDVLEEFLGKSLEVK